MRKTSATRAVPDLAPDPSIEDGADGAAEETALDACRPSLGRAFQSPFQSQGRDIVDWDAEPDGAGDSDADSDADDVESAGGFASAETCLEVEVTVADVGRRLDHVLRSALPAFSRTRLQGLIAAGRVLCDGASVTAAGTRVRVGQRLSVVVPAPEPAEPEAEAIPLAVLYEDDDLIVVDKPAGLVVHPGAGHRSGTLVNGLLSHCEGQLSGIGGVMRPGIVHRLDQDTSGLLVAAKSDRAHRGLASQFAARSIGRRYLALVHGVPAPRAGEVSGRIGRDPRNRKRMAVLRDGGKLAATRYRVVSTEGPSGAPAAGPEGAGPDQGAQRSRFSLVECRLLTGRTHQIRVHLAWLGHPVVGDRLYGGERAKLKEVRTNPINPDEVCALTSLKRQALHAETLTFIHPVTGAFLQFSAPIPWDMQNLLVSLRIV